MAMCLAPPLERMRLIKDGRVGVAYESEYEKLPPGVANLDDLLIYTRRNVVILKEKTRSECEGRMAFRRKLAARFLTASPLAAALVALASFAYRSLKSNA
jgi:hypothetical protein